MLANGARLELEPSTWIALSLGGRSPGGAGVKGNVFGGCVVVVRVREFLAGCIHTYILGVRRLSQEKNSEFEDRGGIYVRILDNPRGSSRILTVKMYAKSCY